MRNSHLAIKSTYSRKVVLLLERRRQWMAIIVGWVLSIPSINQHLGNNADYYYEVELDFSSHASSSEYHVFEFGSWSCRLCDEHNI